MKRTHNILSFIYFDIDNFKYINDTYGHIKGDDILKKVSSILKENLRETDIACRYGGDEFYIILPNSNMENAIEVCQKIIEKFEKEYLENSLSIGIVEVTAESPLNIDKIINMADEKMYLAKKQKGSKIYT